MKLPTFYPSSIVEVKFAKRGEFLNPAAPAVIRHFDGEFAKLYGFLNKGMGRSRVSAGAGSLGSPVLDRLEKFFRSPGDWAEFMKEQVELTGYGRTVNMDSPSRRCRYESMADTLCAPNSAIILSCLQWSRRFIDGKREGLHTMYLLVMYIDVTDLTTQPVNAEETLRYDRE